MNAYDFRLAASGDIPEIVRLYKSALDTPGCTWNADYPSRETADADFQMQALYVLKEKGAIIAAASAGAFDELSHLPWKPKQPCELARIGVLPAMQKQGVGGVMLRHIICAMRQKGFDGIRMLVSKTNASALALYEKFGFERCGEAFLFDHDFYCYQLLI